MECNCDYSYICELHQIQIDEELAREKLEKGFQVLFETVEQLKEEVKENNKRLIELFNLMNYKAL